MPGGWLLEGAAGSGAELLTGAGAGDTAGVARTTEDDAKVEDDDEDEGDGSGDGEGVSVGSAVVDNTADG
jgi:hypothetical protein